MSVRPYAATGGPHGDFIAVLLSPSRPLPPLLPGAAVAAAAAGHPRRPAHRGQGGRGGAGGAGVDHRSTEMGGRGHPFRVSVLSVSTCSRYRGEQEPPVCTFHQDVLT